MQNCRRYMVEYFGFWQTTCIECNYTGHWPVTTDILTANYHHNYHLMRATEITDKALKTQTHRLWIWLIMKRQVSVATSTSPSIIAQNFFSVNKQFFHFLCRGICSVHLTPVSVCVQGNKIIESGSCLHIENEWITEGFKIWIASMR